MLYLNEKCIQEFTRKPQKETPLGGRKWEDNIKMGLKGVGCGLDSSGSGRA
jgi:hypothetical protein